MDGNPIMLKTSNFSTSTGDEAGTAGGGVVSNTTKGKAEFINFSFDVKVEGALDAGLKRGAGLEVGALGPLVVPVSHHPLEHAVLVQPQVLQRRRNEVAEER